MDNQKRRPQSFRFNASIRAYNLIKSFEGLEFSEYKCSAGKRTVGYGHLITRNDRILDRALGRERGEAVVISELEAEDILCLDIRKCEAVLYDNIKAPISQNEFDALISFVFNLGGGNFKASTLLKCLNEGEYLVAADQLLRWCHVGKRVSQGLLKRRFVEYCLMLGEIPPESKHEEHARRYLPILRDKQHKEAISIVKRLI